MKIQPFRGYRYAIAEARDISAVVAPPYDQIDPEIQERLLAMSSHNVVRVTLPKEEPGLDRYQQARQVLEGWLADRVWTPEQRPAIYPYHQTYAVQGRQVTREGFVALGEVTDYAQGVVRPHERTHAGPKQDRLRLLEATGADTGLLFMLTSDPDGALREAVRARGEPIVQAHDLRGELHRLWRITDEATIAGVQALMTPRSVIIADGHHRYETAVAYTRTHPHARLKLMTFCTLQAPGLTILANHRLVRGVEGFSLDRLAERASPWFETMPLADPFNFTPSTRTIGVVSAARALVFRLRDEAAAKVPWPPDTSLAWRALSVSILHEGMLKPLLDITEAKLDARSHVDYTADAGEAVRLARAGRCQAAFLIAPTTTDELRAVVEGGELLPQKSTHFYPKLLDGLVFHRLQQA